MQCHACVVHHRDNAACHMPEAVVTATRLSHTLKANSNGSSSSARMQAYIRGGCKAAALSCCNKQCVQNTAELVSTTVVASPADCSQSLRLSIGRNCPQIAATGWLIKESVLILHVLQQVFVSCQNSHVCLSSHANSAPGKSPCYQEDISDLC